ncbi:transmembrane protein 70, mitochondrial isoform X1 [Phycodurus eques]|uniref:transmembrane protein 70, mitochondrial isoform X1 n=1 Tax=Phycodurus eques TaxID=693459 RepID=UPI002ACDCA08|nr:transmembrane protein 70, mitochondrial isoform X1 [Phycodurus eques]
MLSFNGILSVRVRFISNSFSTTRLVATRPGAQWSASRLGRPRGTHRHAVSRSSLRPKLKVQPRTPSSCLSTRAQSEDENLIYTGGLGTAVRGVKMFSYSTSGASLFLVPQILLKTGLGVQSVALQMAFCGIMGFFTFLTPVLLHFITKGYVVRLYHNPDQDTYTAITYSVFLTEQKTVFHQKQVSIPAVSKMFTTFYADKTGLLVNPDMFVLPQDYNHLMGYDKPFTFRTDYTDRP